MKAQKLSHSLTALSLALVTFLFSAQIFAQENTIFAQENTKSNPFKKSDLVKTLESNSISSAELAERIAIRGVDFQITESVEKELKDAGANDEIINAVQENYTAPKKKGAFGKFGSGLNKAAKIAVKTAPIIAEQMPQVQAAKVAVNAAKKASAEVEQEQKAIETKPTAEEKEPAKEKTIAKGGASRSLNGTAWKIDFGNGVTGTAFLFCKGGKRWEIVPARAGTIGAVGKSWSVSGNILTTVNADDGMVEKWKMTWEGDVLAINDGETTLRLHYNGETQCK